MKRNILFLSLLFFISCESSTVYTQNETVIRHEVYSQSLENNLIGEPATQPIYVCIPPDYYEKNNAYPVVYYLSGFGMKSEDMINGRYYDTRMGEIYDSLMANTDMNEFILVITSGRNLLAGSFYVNSPVTGNWEDFIIKDVREFVDENYRTIKSPSARGLTGHSMGGFGALYLGFKHPDIFGSLYAMSPAVFDENGLNDEGMFSDEEWIRSYITRHEQLKQMDKQTALDSLLSELERKQSFNLYFEYAYGMAFVPETSFPPYVAYPYSLVNNELVVDSALIKKYQDGVGDFDSILSEYLQKNDKVNNVGMEYGESDEFVWIPKGCRHLAGLMSNFGIHNELLTFDGTHGSKIKERLIEHVFPFFAEEFGRIHK